MTVTKRFGWANAALTRLALNSRDVQPRLALMALALISSVMPTSAQAMQATQATHDERMHARALESFRQGRFPEAYGRFIDLANAGHPAAARYALWMCEHGLALFGKDWDCATQEAQDWARAAGVAPPHIKAQSYSVNPIGRNAPVRR